MRYLSGLCHAGLVLALSLGGPSAASLLSDIDPARHVDPFIGTGGHGHTYPGATLPFGMVQLSPDTRLTGWDGCSGYHYTDKIVYGFSHTHLSGTGISDYGDILLMPMTGEPTTHNGSDPSLDSHTDTDQGYASRFDKASERAEPGYYAVHLSDYDVDVELTVTERTGFHLYRFPTGPDNPDAHVIVDLRHRDRLTDSDLRIVSDHEIEGFRRSTAWAKDQVVYFVARFSRPFEPSLVPKKGDMADRALLSFGDEGGEILVQVGISAVDVAGARENLDAELPDWDFDAVRDTGRKRWNDALGRVTIEGGTDEQRTVFYTALYHSLIVPNIFSDMDGRYRGMDGEIHQAAGRRHYTVFSLWDTFRATHPLYTLLERERTGEFLETFLAQYQQGGRLPVWELAGNETDTMIGYHAVPVIVDAYLKGIRGFDKKLALRAMVDSASHDHFGLDAYKRQGFIGARDDNESVSKTLEYAFDDACIARMASALGEDDTMAKFLRRGQSWRHVLDPKTGFMRARRNQRWIVPFDPHRVDNNYTEANSWQYSFFVPHDVEGLKAELGGDEAFIARLDALFTADPATTGRDQADITGLVGQYAHGNEPSHHMAWLYHYAGRPDRSTERVREILTTLYTTQPDGLSGNEDCGQMSSWYVLAAMGLYPVNACSPEYVLAPPLFSGVTMHFEDGKNFTIRTVGEGYIQAATLGDQPLTRSYLEHQEIARGGELVLKLGLQPSDWGSKAKDRPPSSFRGPRVVAAPTAMAKTDVFRGSLTIELDAADPDSTIHYRAMGGETGSDKQADEDFKIYDGPIVLRESRLIRFFADKDGVRSPVVESFFHRVPHDWHITLTHEPSPQYNDGGDMALIDGLRSDENWRIGGWHGFRFTDFEATVDLGETREIHRAGAGFLQDVGSWIWMPSEVVVSVSEDGVDFREIARFSHGIDDKDEETVVRDLTVELEDVRGRYVQIQARNYGTIPSWHVGGGERAWIFIDEVIVE